MNSPPNLSTLTAKLKYKSFSQISRFVFTRTPLLSVFASVYYRIKFHSRYYDFVNRHARRLYQTHQHRLNPYEKQAVAAIKLDGIFADEIEKLCNGSNHLRDLAADANDLLKPFLDKQTPRNKLPYSRIMAIGRDVQNACLPASFVHSFLSEAVLNIVNARLGMLTRLNYVDVWYNMPAIDDNFYYTEKWHRDHEDIKILKVFVYLSAVNELTGPFTYLKGTQSGSRSGHIHPANPPHGVAIDQHLVDELIASDTDNLAICTGLLGTVIIADMTGIHKGGRTTTTPRTVAVATYTSDAGVDPHRYRLPSSIDPGSLSFAARYAMRLE